MKFQRATKELTIKYLPELLKMINGWKYSNWVDENFLCELPKKWKYSFLAINQGELCGFCFGSAKIDSVYYIHLIFICKFYRGKSMGSKMINQIKKIAVENKVSNIECRCPESNEKAILFYHSKGFKTRNIIKDEISGDEADYYLQLSV